MGVGRGRARARGDDRRPNAFVHAPTRSPVGVDTTVVGWRSPLDPVRLENELAFLETVDGALPDDYDDPYRGHYLGSGLRSCRDLLDLVDGLAEPPAVTPIDLDRLIWRQRGRLLLRPGELLWFGFLRNAGTFGGLVPDWLAGHTERGAALWYALVGRWREAERLGAGTPVAFATARDTHRVEPERLGLLHGDRVGELAAELRPLVGDADDFYATLDERARVQARRARPVEFVHALCSYLADAAAPTLVVEFE
jgi:hypothetical protein